MPEPPIVTTLRVSDSVWVVSLRGEHDVSTHAQLQDEIAAACHPDCLVVVDLCEAGFVASSVLSDLVAAKARVEAAGGSSFAVIVRPATAPARLFDVTDARSVFRVFSTRKDAIDSFCARRPWAHSALP